MLSRKSLCQAIAMSSSSCLALWMSMPLLDDLENGEMKKMLIAGEKVKTLAE